MFADSSAFQFASDPFSRHRLPAKGAGDESAGERELGISGASVATVKNVLAPVKYVSINQSFIASHIHLPVPMKFANVEAVVQDVGKGRSMESFLALPKCVAFFVQEIAESLEGMTAAGIQIENSLDRCRPLRMRADGYFSIIGVDVAKRSQPGRPSLPNFFIKPFQNFGSQIIAVVLSHCHHHVERQSTGSPWSELVLDER